MTFYQVSHQPFRVAVGDKELDLRDPARVVVSSLGVERPARFDPNDTRVVGRGDGTVGVVQKDRLIQRHTEGSGGWGDVYVWAWGNRWDCLLEGNGRRSGDAITAVTRRQRIDGGGVGVDDDAGTRDRTDPLVDGKTCSTRNDPAERDRFACCADTHRTCREARNLGWCSAPAIIGTAAAPT